MHRLRLLLALVALPLAGFAQSKPAKPNEWNGYQRLDFKVGEAEWADTSMLANDVQVRFKLTLTGLAPL